MARRAMTAMRMPKTIDTVTSAPSAIVRQGCGCVGERRPAMLGDKADKADSDFMQKSTIDRELEQVSV
jgi:hypothetical protein